MTDSLKIFPLKLFLQVKAAFTRTYNKESYKTPYAIRAAAKKGRRGGAEDSQTIVEDSYAPEEFKQQVKHGHKDDDIKNSAMIKAKKKQTKAEVSRTG